MDAGRKRGTCGGKSSACCFVMQHADGSLCCTLKPPSLALVPVVIPPTVKNPNGSQGMTCQGFFPPTLAGWSCGEWKAREAWQEPLKPAGNLPES